MNSYDKALQDLNDEITRQRHSKSTDQSEEEMWNEYLDKTFPVQGIFGESNKVVNKQVVMSTLVFAIVDKNFEIIEQVTPVFDNRGEFTKEVQELKAKKLHKNKRLQTDDSIDHLKVMMFTEFSLNRSTYMYKFKKSSKEFEEFKEWHDKKTKEFLDNFLNKD